MVYFLPEILIDIVQRVGNNGFRYLAPIIASGRDGINAAFWYDRLAVVNPTRSDWRVRVKILRIYVSETGDLWLILSDELGTRVNAYVDRSLKEEYLNFLWEGHWNIIQNFDVSINDSPSGAVNRGYKITISSSTYVSGSPEISSNLFASFAPFQTILDGSIGTNFLIELVGKITRVGPIKNGATRQVFRVGALLPTHPNVIDGYRLVFYIQDINGKEIRCLAMANEALEVANTIHRDDIEDVLCVLRWWKLHEFGTDRFGVQSEDSVSQMLIYPQIH